MRRRWLGLLTFFAAAAVSMVMSGSASAVAQPMGRNQFYGYFYNQCKDYGGDVFAHANGVDALPLSKVYDAASLIQFMVNAYNEGPGEDRTGEAYVVLSMDGYRTAPGGVIPQSVSPTSAYFKKFENIVNYYYANHWIAGIDNTTTTTGYAYNTYYQGSAPAGDPGCNKSKVDDSWFNDVGSTNGAIIFHDPGTNNYYIIRRYCGNPLGSDQLTIPNFQVNVKLSNNGTPAQIEAGQSYSVGVQISATGNSSSEYASLQVPQPAQVDQPCTPWCNGTTIGMGSLTPNYNYSYGFANNPADAAPNVTGNRWTWYTNPIPAGSSADAYFDFTVAANAVPGSIITFTGYFYPSNIAQGESTSSISFVVASERQPAVDGQNGDVQVGGGLCGQSTSSGYIKGYPGAGSEGQYVLSAGGGSSSIGDFASNAEGPDILNVGQNGQYTEACREDLLSLAQAYRVISGAVYTPLGSGSYNISGWKGLYYINGSASISGQVNNSVTIVSTGGNLTINGDITLTGASETRQNLPSLGIIAQNDIDIDPAVTNVDAYLFADGTIDTCVSGAGSCSTGQLTVNGFLMAHNIMFDRLGPLDGSGTPVSEKVVLNPQIYLNPPQFFDTSSDPGLIQGEGEKSPLF